MKNIFLSMLLMLSIGTISAQSIQDKRLDSRSQISEAIKVESVTPAIWSINATSLEAPEAIKSSEVNSVTQLSNNVNSKAVNELNEHSIISGYIIKLNNKQSYAVPTKYKVGDTVDINTIQTY